MVLVVPDGLDSAASSRVLFPECRMWCFDVPPKRSAAPARHAGHAGTVARSRRALQRATARGHPRVVRSLEAADAPAAGRAVFAVRLQHGGTDRLRVGATTSRRG